MNQPVNRRVVLAARPRGTPTPRDFRLDAQPVPDLEPRTVLLRTLYLSLDPYMRGTMDEAAPLYSASTPLGGVMVGQTVSRVVASDLPGLHAGDLVLAQDGWQEYALSDGSGLVRIEETEYPSWALGVLGMPSFPAYVGLREIARLRPNETMVVTAATGAVGAVAGQLGALRGARVIGIAGGAQKCRYAIEELGYDVCIDRHDPTMAEQLAVACPDGVDVLFENVAGPCSMRCCSCSTSRRESCCAA